MDGEFIKTYQSVIFKSVVDALNQQIALLIEHKDYLEEELRNQNNHISHLMGIITTSQINQSFNTQTTINTSMEFEINKSNINDVLNSTIISDKRNSSDIPMVKRNS